MGTWNAALRWLTACRKLWTTSTNTAAPTLMSLLLRMKKQPNSFCNRWTAPVYSGTPALALLMATALALVCIYLQVNLNYHYVENKTRYLILLCLFCRSWGWYQYSTDTCQRTCRFGGTFDHQVGPSRGGTHSGWLLWARQHEIPSWKHPCAPGEFQLETTEQHKVMCLFRGLCLSVAFQLTSCFHKTV